MASLFLSPSPAPLLSSNFSITPVPIKSFLVLQDTISPVSILQPPSSPTSSTVPAPRPLDHLSLQTYPSAAGALKYSIAQPTKTPVTPHHALLPRRAPVKVIPAAFIGPALPTSPLVFNATAPSVHNLFVCWPEHRPVLPDTSESDLAASLVATSRERVQPPPSPRQFFYVAVGTTVIIMVVAALTVGPPDEVENSDLFSTAINIIVEQWDRVSEKDWLSLDTPLHTVVEIAKSELDAHATRFVNVVTKALLAVKRYVAFWGELREKACDLVARCIAGVFAALTVALVEMVRYMETIRLRSFPKTAAAEPLGPSSPKKKKKHTPKKRAAKKPDVESERKQRVATTPIARPTTPSPIRKVGGRRVGMARPLRVVTNTADTVDPD
ncbi:hypothetical protein C0991_006850 [Blastosporella zonata]|nr:hypothetical protein C0991_006850 [Blastosporella zonata]